MKPLRFTAWMRPLTNILALFLSGLLAGCVTYSPKPISLERVTVDFDARSLDNPALKKFLEMNRSQALPAWPLKSWEFETLTLAAFFYHPGLEVARAQWAVARGGVMTAGGRPNPTVSATPGYNFSAASGVSPWIPGVNVDLPIETAGKRGHRLARAHQLSEAARLNVSAAAWQVRGVLRASLVNHVSAVRRLFLLQQQLTTQQQAFRLLEQRVAVGALAMGEIQSVRIALEKTRLEMNEAQRQGTESRHRLAEAAGVPVNALAGVELRAPAPLDVGLTSAQARQHALSTRADIAAALVEYEAAQTALQSEIAKQYPDVHLGTGYQWDQGESKWNLGLTVEIPVLNRNQGPVAEAGARRTEAGARLLAIQARVVGEIDRTVAVYRGAQARQESLKDLTVAQARQRAVVEAQVKAGAGDQLDLLNATVELGLGALMQAESALQLAQAAGAVEEAVQSPLDAISSTGLLTSLRSSDSPSEPTVAGSAKNVRSKAKTVPQKNQEPKK